MPKKRFSVKKGNKIALVVLSSILFVSALFWIFIYYLGGIDYMYHSQGVANAFCWTCVIIALSLALFVSVIIFMFKGKRIIKIVCAILLVISIPVSAYLGLLGMAANFLGTNGCSYTNDIANYGKYDRENNIAYFPQSITEDMTVVDFSYFYTYIDIHQTDIYLEVKFSDKDTMEKYLDTAKAAFSKNGFLEYENPYNSKYTDIVENRAVLYSDNYYASNIEFCGDTDYKYVEMSYSSVSYSYDELTIIYNRTGIGNDIECGNNPDNGEYYPRFLTRFNVEWNKANNFSQIYSKEDK